MNGFKKGNFVKVVPNNLFELSKGQLNYREVTSNSRGVKDERVMLGGEYEVLDVAGDDKILKLLNNPYSESKKYLNYMASCYVKPLEEVKLCPFKIGDKIKWSAHRSDVNYLFLSLMQDCKDYDEENVFSVTSILNSYFIQLNDKEIFCFWKDFEKIT